MFSKQILILAALCFTQQIAAIASPQTSPPTESSAGCIECSTSSPMDSLMRFTENLTEITIQTLDIEYIFDKMHYSNKCDSFAADGMNKWGTVLTKQLSLPKYESLLKEGHPDIRKYCTHFDDMDISERKALNILILTAMSHYESSCNFREKAPGPNGTAAGLLQLHKGKEQKYSDGCRKGDSTNAERSLICGLSMFNDQFERGEKLFSRSAYWEVLRPQGRSKKAVKIMSAIKKFPACETKETTVAAAKHSSKKKVASTKHKSKNRVAQK